MDHIKLLDKETQMWQLLRFIFQMKNKHKLISKRYAIVHQNYLPIITGMGSVKEEWGAPLDR